MSSDNDTRDNSLKRSAVYILGIALVIILILGIALVIILIGSIYLIFTGNEIPSFFQTTAYTAIAALAALIAPAIFNSKRSDK